MYIKIDIYIFNSLSPFLFLKQVEPSNNPLQISFLRGYLTSNIVVLIEIYFLNIARNTYQITNVATTAIPMDASFAMEWNLKNTI